MSGLFPLHPPQVKILDCLKASVRSGKRRPLVMAPTGSGKTVLAAHVVAGALAKRNRVAFLVPLVNLVDQTFTRFMENGIDPGDMGIIQADHEWRRPHAPVQICSVQTLARRGYPEADVYVIDEAHLRDAKLHAFLASQDARRVLAIGLSATPYAKGLGLVYDDLIAPVSMSELIEFGYLSKFTVFAPSHPDLSDIAIDKKSGDYQTTPLSERMSKPQIVADVVENWLNHGENRPTLCFAVDRAHAAVLHDQFEKSGVASAYVDAFTPREERLDLAKRFGRGDIKVICNIGTMTTGVDLDVRCIIFASPTKSPSLLQQKIGRGLRTADGKDICLIFDHTNTHNNLGCVTGISISALDTSKPGAGDSKAVEKKEGQPRECPACHCLAPFGATECPSCGMEFRRTCSVETVAGELVEFGSGKKAKKNSATARLAAVPKLELFGQIKQVQKDRKWSDGRASHVYKSITDHWPNNVRHATLRPPSLELLAFIRHKDMAYAKAMQKSKLAMEAAE